MSEVTSSASSSNPEPPGAKRGAGGQGEATGDGLGGGGAPDLDAMEAAFGVHVRRAPPLAWLAAAAAFTAMLLNQVLVPAMGASEERVTALRLDRAGDFATNLGAVAGLIAIVFGLMAFIRHSTLVSLRQRLMLACFSGMFLPTIAVATLFERQRTTTQLVVFALGAAMILGTVVNVAAARAARDRVARAAALLASTMAVLMLISQALELGRRVTLSATALEIHAAIRGVGELCYLVLLGGSVLFVLPRKARGQDRLGRTVAFVLLPALLGGLYAVERALQSDYALLLYHAQRVSLLLDVFPRLYAVPIALSLSSVVGAAIGDNAMRRQAAAGVLLLLSAGYAPVAPGRLLSLALAMVLLARAAVGTGEHEQPAEPPPPSFG
ncbi:MAG: hypothetical protein PVI30_19680 [Myxococcales bacterium]